MAYADANSMLIGIAVVMLVFARSWFVAMQATLDRCTSLDSCTLTGVMWDVVKSMMQGFSALAMAFFFMWFVEVVIVGVISMPIHTVAEEESAMPKFFQMSAGFRILTAWTREWRFLVAILLAILSIVVLLEIVVMCIRWYSESKKLERVQTEALIKRGVTAVYIYGLGSMLMYVGYQMWIIYARSTCDAADGCTAISARCG